MDNFTLFKINSLNITLKFFTILIEFQAAEACGSLEIDNALAAVKALEQQLGEMRVAADEQKLRPLPDDNVSFPFFEIILFVGVNFIV